MSIIGDFLTGKLRDEMRQRVDEVLRAGSEWSKTARDLIEALNRLTEAIEKGNTKPSKTISRVARQLARQTKRLTKAFENHNKTLEKIVRKF